MGIQNAESGSRTRSTRTSVPILSAGFLGNAAGGQLLVGMKPKVLNSRCRTETHSSV